MFDQYAIILMPMARYAVCLEALSPLLNVLQLSGWKDEQ